MKIQHELDQVVREGEEAYAWWDPASNDALTRRFCADFTSGLHEWLAEDDPQVHTFHDIHLHYMLNSGLLDLQAPRIFMHWVEFEFSDFTLLDDQLHLHPVLDEAHMSLLSDLDPWTLRLRYQNLQQRLTVLQASHADQARERLDHNPRQARQHPASMSYPLLTAAELCRRAWRIDARPSRTPVLSCGPYLVIHLYAGRRCEHDFHHHYNYQLEPHKAVAEVSKIGNL